MLSRLGGKIADRWTQIGSGSRDRRLYFKFVVQVAVLLIAFIGGECQAAENQECAKALELMATQGFQKGSVASLEKDICAVDVASYASLVEFILGENGGNDVEEIEAKLLKAAESGNISAKIIYTLVFTNIFNGKFDSDLTAARSYSRYVPYIDGVYLLGQPPDSQYGEKLGASRILIDEARSNDVLEAYLFEYIFSLRFYRQDRNPIFRNDAAVSLLMFASFFGRVEVARSHLSKLFSFSETELKGFEATVQNSVGRILIRPDNAACALRTECVANVNLRRLICQVRDRKGLVLLNISEPSCTRLAQPFADLYRRRVEQMFTEVLSATQH